MLVNVQEDEEQDDEEEDDGAGIEVEMADSDEEDFEQFEAMSQRGESAAGSDKEPDEIEEDLRRAGSDREARLDVFLNHLKHNKISKGEFMHYVTKKLDEAKEVEIDAGSDGGMAVIREENTEVEFREEGTTAPNGFRAQTKLGSDSDSDASIEEDEEPLTAEVGVQTKNKIHSVEC